jgi:hypothetical protein
LKEIQNLATTTRRTQKLHGSRREMEMEGISQRFWRILYVDSQIDEKQSESILESGVSELSPPCNFIVVSNIFSAMERIQFSPAFDMMMIKEKKSDFELAKFEKVIRNSNILIPIVQILPRESNKMNKSNSKTAKNGINIILYPYTFAVLKSTIIGCIKEKFGQSFDPYSIPSYSKTASIIPVVTQSIIPLEIENDRRKRKKLRSIPLSRSQDILTCDNWIPSSLSADDSSTATVLDLTASPSSFSIATAADSSSFSASSLSSSNLLVNSIDELSLHQRNQLGPIHNDSVAAKKRSETAESSMIMITAEDWMLVANEFLSDDGN